MGAEIHDDKLTERDGCQFRLSTNGAYKDWSAASGRSDVTWAIGIPSEERPEITAEGGRGFTYTCRKTPTGYVVEGSAPLAELGVGPGDAMGFLLDVSDDDDTPNRNSAGWARKQVLLVPHRPTFSYWNDVRTCGELKLGK